MPADKIVDFGPTIELFASYVKKIKEKCPGEYNSELAQEALERLRQIDWILERIFLICKRLAHAPLKAEDFLMPIETSSGSEANIDEGELLNRGFLIVRAYTESFYYISFRLRTLLKKGMPELSGFESEGIRDVRNHLIEHPEGSQVFVQTFDLGLSPKGPRLKVDATRTNPHHIDDGLFVNAEGFKRDLEDALAKAIEGLK